MGQKESKGFVQILQEYSIFLLAGVVTAVVFANVFPDLYEFLIHFGAFDTLCNQENFLCIESHDHHGEFVAAFFGHHITLHWLTNDVFMVFFFGIAAKEITESALPGGALNPVSKAINPLFATIGGVFGPIAVYLLLTNMVYGSADTTVLETIQRGWGIPTATDIALAWLVARMVFGSSHPAVNFLLLLAVADDAIGLGIIAIFYGDPANPAAPEFLVLILIGMAIAFGLRKSKVQSWIPYIVFAGFFSWLGLILAHLHPALALVPIVPFLPGPTRDTGLFNADDEVDEAQHVHGGHGKDHSPLHNYEHDTKLFVDVGLFVFGFMNAGVAFASINAVTWIVLTALIVGKTIGVAGCSFFANLIGFKYPKGMGHRHVIVAGVIAGLGLTVALFVSGEAFNLTSGFQGPAKMGALFSAIAAPLAFALGKVLAVKKLVST